MQKEHTQRTPKFVTFGGTRHVCKKSAIHFGQIQGLRSQRENVMHVFNKCDA